MGYVNQTAELEVKPEEINAAVVEQARSVPGREEEVLDFFRSNPQAVEQIRAPLYEDKVVDFALELARVTEKPVAVEELMRDPDEDEATEQPTAKS